MHTPIPAVVREWPRFSGTIDQQPNGVHLRCICGGLVFMDIHRIHFAPVLDAWPRQGGQLSYPPPYASYRNKSDTAAKNSNVDHSNSGWMACRSCSCLPDAFRWIFVRVCRVLLHALGAASIVVEKAISKAASLSHLSSLQIPGFMLRRHGHLVGSHLRHNTSRPVKAFKQDHFILLW